jgi:hypothetical protein
MSKLQKGECQLSNLIDPNKPRDVLADAKRFYKTTYPKASFKTVARAFEITRKLYEGRFPGYQACAVEYHDYTHSVAVFGATSRLLDGCALSGLDMSAERAAETLVAALLHDSGYLREKGDDKGSGAQYTKIHVDRSAAFARREASAFGLEAESADRVARIILGTDLARNWEELVLKDEEERLGAEILAAADLLGQMADRAYLEKLLFLYHEFREAGIGGYDTAFDILRKTAGFYDSTKARLDTTLGRVSGRAKEHFRARYGVDKDLYREAIERQMAYLASILADNTSNFRTKLKRLDLAAIESRQAQ